MFTKTIIWASVHPPLEIQEDEFKESNTRLLYLIDLDEELFDSITNITKKSNLKKLVYNLLMLATKHSAVLVQPAGNPAFQEALGFLNSAYDLGASVIYAHSTREAVEIINEQKEVIKTSKFVHDGWWSDGDYYISFKDFLNSLIIITKID